MNIRYIDLVDDHNAILRAGNDLLNVADRATAGLVDLVTALHNLGALVRDHIAAETPLIQALDNSAISGPWLVHWQTNRPGYLALREDWQEFLSEWNEGAVTEDPAIFRQALRAILGRLDERLRFESKTFYAIALQTGNLQFVLN